MKAKKKTKNEPSELGKEIKLASGKEIATYVYQKKKS